MCTKILVGPTASHNTYPVVDEDDTQIIGQIVLPPEQATSSMENVMWGKSVTRGEKRRAHLLQVF